MPTPKQIVHSAGIFVALFLLILVIVEYRDTKVAPGADASGTTETSAEEPLQVELRPDMSREAIAAAFGAVLELDEQMVGQLHHTYRSMQWDTFNDGLLQYMTDTYELSPDEREILVTHATEYLDREADVLEGLYEPGLYELSGGERIVELASMLVDRVPTTSASFVAERIDTEQADKLHAYVTAQADLLPDLVPLPPQDVGIKDEPSRRLLVFTTVYYNKGPGDLELRADPDTIDVPGDVDRQVNQHIERTDGTTRTQSAGTFEWHHEHIHYHFSDFIEYRLDGIDNDEQLGGDGLLQKSTFCIRDVSRVTLDERIATGSAQFRICGRERQGVSVGWGDAYFSTYPDQNLDISELPSGTYRLTFDANPADRFEEVTKENNTASADIRYDKEHGTVEVIRSEPKDIPEFEHIYVEQKF